MKSTKLPDFREEKRLWRKGYHLVIGVDEVGRGAFAGPIVAGAVAFNARGPVAGFLPASARELRAVGNPSTRTTPRFGLAIRIDDSKRLKPNERKRAAKWIKENCLAYEIGEVGVRTINRVGIGKATQLAMRRAIVQLLNCSIANNVTMKQSNNCFLLVDAFHIRYLRGIGLQNQKAIKKGDQKSISIAAASILAKVYRDRLMQKFTKRYKEYHWGRNKGYGTRKHQEEILKRGSTPLHRRQFVETFLHHLSK